MAANGGPAKMNIESDSTFSVTSSSVVDRLAPLFAENIFAKSYRTAASLTAFDNLHNSTLSNGSYPAGQTPSEYPEYVPQGGPDTGRYMLREPQFWTCGFFPGTLYSILERLTRFPQSVRLSDQNLIGSLRRHIWVLAQLCAGPLEAMAARTDTHDVGFMIMPAFQRHWELTGDTNSLDVILRAAQSLASRFVTPAGVIRSWDQRIQKNVVITSQEHDLIVIIDSMCNLQLLYYAASHFPEHSQLYDIATRHATTLLRTHLRPERMVPNAPSWRAAYTSQWYSTYHVANLDPLKGDIKQQFTAQGYADKSTWARGQAWAILGYAQTYKWTRKAEFLEAACGVSEYFLYRLASAPGCVDSPETQGNSSPTSSGRYVPLWDFDAPIEDEACPLRDSSAGAIAANGLLILYQILTGLERHDLASHFRDGALNIAEDLIRFSLASETARFTRNNPDVLTVEDTVSGQRFEGLLKNGTANNNENAMKRYANHGLVYGDYYLVELGNQLLNMGII